VNPTGIQQDCGGKFDCLEWLHATTVLLDYLTCGIKVQQNAFTGLPVYLSLNKRVHLYSNMLSIK